MIPVIKVKEYEPIYIGDKFSEQDKIISKRQAAEIEKVENLGGESIFRWGRNKITPQQWVGLISVSGLQIEILPKIDNINLENDLRSNLLYMLSIANDVPYKINNLGNVSTNNSTLLESYITVFIDKLFELVKKGLINQYTEQESNESYLKGKFLVPQQIHYNLFNKAKFYVRYDEYSNNNLINRIIKATIIKLTQVSTSYENKKKLAVLKNYFIDVDERIFNNEDFNKVVLTRIHSSYKGIIEMSKMFWKDSLPDFYSGGVTTYNLLFDMNKIFELFIRQILKLHSQEILGETLEFKINKSSKYLLHDNKRNNYFRLIPDIVINDALTSQTKIIIDTKWKKLNYSKRNFGIFQEDIYQMYAYAREYSCSNIVILYPLLESNKAILPEFFNTTIKNKEIKISVQTIDLSYKLPTDVGEIIRQMKGIVQSIL